MCYLYPNAFLISFGVCPYHFPCALPHRHCHPALSSRSCLRAGEVRPAGGPTNSCCWASPTRPGRCRSSSAAIPAGEGPGAGSPPRRSLGETATRETKRPGVTIKGTVLTFSFAVIIVSGRAGASDPRVRMVEEEVRGRKKKKGGGGGGDYALIGGAWRSRRRALARF